jgi:hypothetical protein
MAPPRTESWESKVEGPKPTTKDGKTALSPFDLRLWTALVRLSTFDCSLDEFHNLLCGGAGLKNFGYASLLQGRDVLVRNDAAYDQEHVL